MISSITSSSPLLVALIGLVMIFSFGMFAMMLWPSKGITATQSDINVTIGYGVVFGGTAIAMYLYGRRLR